MAGDPDIVLGDRQRVTGGDAQLHLDEIQARHGLGHRMLDLQAGVHLEERDRRLGAGATDHELDRAGTLVAHVPGQRHRAVAQRRSNLRRDARRR